MAEWLAIPVVKQGRPWLTIHSVAMGPVSGLCECEKYTLSWLKQPPLLADISVGGSIAFCGS